MKTGLRVAQYLYLIFSQVFGSFATRQSVVHADRFAYEVFVYLFSRTCKRICGLYTVLLQRSLMVLNWNGREWNGRAWMDR